MPNRDYYFQQRRLVSQNEAAMIEDAHVPRSRFKNAWTRVTAFDAGYLVPFLIQEVLPGDHLSYEFDINVRMATPLFPIYSNQRVDTFIFFTPNRLLWTNWPKFMGEQQDPSSSIAFTVPQIETTGGAAVGSLLDHMGLPYVTGNIDTLAEWSISALPFRAYNLIYNQWFRDQNLINSATINTGDGPDSLAAYTLRRRAKAHDYFTSALPWAQKFTPPTVPLGGLAPIQGLGAIGSGENSGTQAVTETGGVATSYTMWRNLWDVADPNKVAMEMQTGGPAVYADLSQATGVAINTFRQAFLVQSLLERDARGGTRYVELIRAHFRVTNPDFRLQRPEYIGGGQTPIRLTPIAQTAPTEDLPVGALGAAGTAAGSHRASYAATEHGYILGLINVRSELAYQQGVHKHWHRLTRYDFYWPALAGLGEQAILRKEIYSRGDEPGEDDNAVFGYQERWHEYRTHTSEVTGIMRSNVAGTLDSWHLAQNFSSFPALNQTFIEDNPPMSRVLAAGALAANQQYITEILIHRTAVRPIPAYGTPVLLGRF